MLSQQNIKDKGLITGTDPNNFYGPTYNLRVDKIYELDSNGIGSENYVLKPRGQVLVTTKEVFNLPDNVIGYTTVKNTLSIEGIYALNIGIVDAKYEGPISTILINFGNKDKPIQTNDTILRMTFHDYQVDENDTPLNPPSFRNKNSYARSRSYAAGNSLASTFISIDEVKHDVTKHVKTEFRKSIGLLTIAIIATSIIAICITLTIFALNKPNEIYYDMDKFNKDRIEITIDSLSNDFTKKLERLERLHKGINK